MRSVSGKDLVRAVERNGWLLLRIHGSHHIFGKPGSVVRLSIPVHGAQPLKVGLLRHLMSLAELSESDLDG
ncbi:MAG: type II toxin-antitoxin system HicA family toxin [Thermodesulfobacteriota bacterium]